MEESVVALGAKWDKDADGKLTGLIYSACH